MGSKVKPDLKTESSMTQRKQYTRIGIDIFSKKVQYWYWCWDRIEEYLVLGLVLVLTLKIPRIDIDIDIVILSYRMKYQYPLKRAGIAHLWPR